MNPLRRRAGFSAGAVRGVFTTAAVAVLAAVGAPRADATRLAVRHVPGGVAVRLDSPRTKGVLFLVDRRPVVRRLRGPFRVVLRPGKMEARSRLHWLVVRELRSGHRLAGTRFSFASSGRRRRLPTISIVAAPPSSTTATDARVAWTTTRATGTTCQLDAAVATSCESPKYMTGLASGRHVLLVTAFNAAGFVAATVAWTIAASAAPATQPAPPASAPTVALTSQPSASTSSTSATFVWSASGATSTRCSLDGAAASDCASPVSYSALPAGAHNFTVTVANAAGSASASAAWTVTAAANFGVAPPQPPSTYAVPTGASRVQTSAQLISALQGSARDIVLADGVYDNGSFFTNPNGSRLYAEHLGQAVLKAGISMGGNWAPGGGIVRGLTFDVSEPGKTLNDAIVQIWGLGGNNTQVLDCVFRGNGAIGTGVTAVNPQGLVARRDTFSNFTGSGLLLGDNRLVSYGSATPKADAVSDIVVDGVSRAVPGSSNGTSEAGLWIANPVVNGVSRIKVRNVSISGIETVGNSWDTVFSDLDINVNGLHQASGVGVYLEHYNHRNVFRNFVIYARVGFNAEWDDPSWGSVAAAHSVTIADGTIDAAGSTLPGHTVGVYLDHGTESTTVRNVTFRNQNWAGIGAYANVGTNVFEANSFQGLAAGAVPVSNAHI